MASKRIAIGTDVAAFVLFHPDDLAHRKDDPIAWYAYGFAWQRESRAGRLVAFGTGADGGYGLRLTTEGLTAAEAPLACQSWSFPLAVRHGRILLDNTDALPGEEQMTDPAGLPEQWFELDSDAYRVTVHALAWKEAPGAVGADGRVSPDAPPDYVVVFEPVADIAAVPVAAAMPRLLPDRDSAPGLETGVQVDALFAWPRKPPEGTEFPALPVASSAALIPGQDLSLPVDDAVAAAIYPERGSGREGLKHLVLAPAFETDGLACLARAHGLSRMGDDAARLKLRGEAVVRIRRGGRAQPLQTVTVVPLDKPDMAAPAEALEPFRARLLALGREDAVFRTRLRHPSFELERLAALGTAEAVTGWALAHLDLPFAARLACYAGPAAQRIEALTRFLDGGGLPPESAAEKRSLLGRLFGRG
ncbi:hypothetical protein [Inquilinus limosus]|uniref:hypothetical protein n=1 Tax=Inquilinus limosus TaxID=171674 RepID=UPI0004137993|nr:hypothetical protein [Inquilinus limosus]